ncbi:hypothetical protein Pla100_51790 [Neorhodopirellula pilleata]|uniref:Uncharacterized protein n=1 Tax=Neorhodopirellula pilleata TaxID=2714738 RepID=A0A5C5ZWF4_9BACT|nr:hypothetical protein Pla100_51790 [Neorhodopirellula pilleata]
MNLKKRVGSKNYFWSVGGELHLLKRIETEEESIRPR